MSGSEISSTSPTKQSEAISTENSLSPYLPGTKIQYAFDSTSLGEFKTCPRKYFYSQLEGWRKVGRPKTDLEYGQIYHSALETYDKRKASGNDHRDSMRAAVHHVLHHTWDVEAAKPKEFDDNIKTRYTLLRSVVWYLEQFEDDPCKTVILRDGRPAVELSFRLPVDNGIVLCGHLDRVVEFQGSKYVMDRKTTKTTISSYYFDRYAPDNQMSLYTLAGRIILESPVRGVIIDAAQIAIGFSRFERGFISRSEGELEEWLDQTYAWIASAQAMARNPVAESFPMNDKSCHNYGGCPFRGVCASDPRTRASVLESEYERRFWNPLETRT